jgi:hypothetical protein
VGSQEKKTLKVVSAVPLPQTNGDIRRREGRFHYGQRELSAPLW